MHKQAIERLGRDLGDLLASHERGRSLEEFTVYRDDPIGFIREVLHGDPWKRQEEIAETVLGRTGSRVGLPCGGSTPEVVSRW